MVKMPTSIFYLHKNPDRVTHPGDGMRCIFLMVCILLLVACAAPLPPPGEVSPFNNQGLFKKVPSDADMIHEGTTCLGTAGKTNDYARARAAFDALLKTYPESKWRHLSETLIMLIDTMQSCNEKDLLFEKGKKEIFQLLQENDRLRKEIRQLKTETVKLSEENEQMKKDMQLLKDLEVEMEKREKMLR